MDKTVPGRKVMTRKASDNKYLHKDFHVSMNILLKYIYETFGKKEMVNYLIQYTDAYHKPLSDELMSGDLSTLCKYFADIYKKEEWPVKINCEADFLEIVQDACPGITQIKEKGETPCPYYLETYNTVYQRLCESTAFEYELEYFDEETGACKQVFRRKEKN
ncbi:hypothetical protein D1614_18460 [Maribellus luteus]|uniref:Uncharacterized protein n=1 Tax=Maribellus luteus TaxID=2305463 RepID=A0A399SUQ8_9BACT|nr:hypothetical protein [Maribellus luteus]RIJ46649.1 hypothetical protein D1614_18460 [Maribellus luteus]